MYADAQIVQVVIVVFKKKSALANQKNQMIQLFEESADAQKSVLSA